MQVRNLPLSKSDESEHYQPKVLFVEDDPIAQFIHKRMLRRLNCEVDMADNAAKAYAMANNGYDLILLDLGLPDKNGIELIQEIQQSKKYKRSLRIIVLTANHDEKIRQECLGLGIDTVLHKPIDINKLNDSIYQC